MLLSVKDLWVHYDGAEVIRGLSLDLEEGSFVSLIGANGHGKSTLLRTISGLKHPTRGEIWFQGERIDRKATYEIVGLGISHCPEGRRLFPNMSVLENLRMGSYLRNDKASIRKDIEIIYNSFPRLRERAKQRAGSLSGGEQQMVALARSLLSNPRLLLLDEPSLGLAPILVRELMCIIFDIRQRGLSILLVEQNSRLALSAAEYAYVLEMGRFVLQGKVEEVSNHPYVKQAYLG